MLSECCALVNAKMLVGDSTVKATVLIVVMQLWYRCDTIIDEDFSST